jgi:hypothetical protein
MYWINRQSKGKSSIPLSPELLLPNSVLAGRITGE